jgi:hypothetical protein
VQTLARNSVSLHGKRFFLILGLVLLVVGASLIISHLLIIRPDRIFADSVQRTSILDYVSPSFHAEKGDLLEFDLTSSNCSVLRLVSQGGATVYLVNNYNVQAFVNGAIYNQSLQINATTDYTVALENWAEHALDPNARMGGTIVYDNNTFSGSFYLMRTPAYSPQILLSGEALLAASCGVLLVPVLSYFRFKAKRLGINL